MQASYMYHDWVSQAKQVALDPVSSSLSMVCIVVSRHLSIQCLKFLVTQLRHLFALIISDNDDATYQLSEFWKLKAYTSSSMMMMYKLLISEILIFRKSILKHEVCMPTEFKYFKFKCL